MNLDSNKNTHDDISGSVSRSLLALGAYTQSLGASKAYRLGNTVTSAVDMIRAGKVQQLFRKMKQRLVHGWTNSDLRSPEWRAYVENRLRENAKYRFSSNGSTVTVYTCITGGYDSLVPPFPLLDDPGMQYIAFVDDSVEQLNGWQKASIPDSLADLSSQGINRYIKLHPGEFCSSDFSIYIDGNLWLLDNPRWMCDIARCSPIGFAIFSHGLRDTVAKEYKACCVLGKGEQEGLRKQFARACELGIEQSIGLYEAPVLVSDLRNDKQAELYDQWWQEYTTHGFQRDQLALPSALAVCGYGPDDVGILGENVRNDSRLLRREHEAR